MTPFILLGVKWIFKVNREGIIQEIRWRWWQERRLCSHLDIMSVEFFVPGPVGGIEALWLLPEKQAVHYHSKGPDIKSR